MNLRAGGVRTIVTVALIAAPAAAHATYSIVAADRATGQVGGAVTSCVGSSGVDVVYRPSVGHGAVNAQAAANANGRDRAVALLGMDVEPANIIVMITATAFDASATTRQYGIVDLMGRGAGYTGPGTLSYKEDRPGTLGGITYSVQGNILTSRAVIDQAEAAFRGSGCDLADRLMRALEGGAQNGEGDSRCTPRGLPSDAASLEVDRTGEAAGSYLKLAVAGTGNTSAVVQIRGLFDAWRATHPCDGGRDGGAGAGGGRGGRGGGGAGGTRGIGEAAGRSDGGGAAGAAGAAGGSSGGGGCGCHTVGSDAVPGSILAVAIALWLAGRARRSVSGSGSTKGKAPVGDGG